MNTVRRLNLLAAILLAMTMTLSFAGAAYASDDNSLADLGIQTQGAEVSPTFRYDIWEYSVQVPAGTTELELTPRVTNPSATINMIILRNENHIDLSTCLYFACPNSCANTATISSTV